METEESGRMRCGREKSKRRDSVKGDLEMAGVNSREWETMVEDRYSWR